MASKPKPREGNKYITGVKPHKGRKYNEKRYNSRRWRALRAAFLASFKNIVSSSFARYSSSFDATTYIRTIGIYDEDKNLIAVAKTANPVKKTAEQDYTFKLKLDL